MKPFIINNHDSLELVFTIGAKTYEQGVELSGFTNWSRGDASSTNGTLSFPGTYADFINATNGSRVDIDLRIAGNVHNYTTAQIKHPVKYSEGVVSLELDTIPVSTTLGVTDGKGNELPYSFGKPWVKAVKVTERILGSALGDFDVVSESSLIDVINAYTKLVPNLPNFLGIEDNLVITEVVPEYLGRQIKGTMFWGTDGTYHDYKDEGDSDKVARNKATVDYFQVFNAVIGEITSAYLAGSVHAGLAVIFRDTYKTVVTAHEETQNRNINPELVQACTFLQKVMALAEKDPERQHLYEELADLVCWVQHSNLAPWVINYAGLFPSRVALESDYPSTERINIGDDTVSEQRGVGVKLSYVARKETSNTEEYPRIKDKDINGKTVPRKNTLITYADGKKFGEMYNVRTFWRSDADSLSKRYTDIITELQELPSSLRVDLSNLDLSEGEHVNLKINGAEVSGIYTSGELRELKVTATPINLTFKRLQDSSLAAYRIEIDRYVRLEGMYVSILSQTPNISWVTKVTSQDGVVCTLEIVPYLYSKRRNFRFPKIQFGVDGGTILLYCPAITPDLVVNRSLNVTDWVLYSQKTYTTIKFDGEVDARKPSETPEVTVVNYPRDTKVGLVKHSGGEDGVDGSEVYYSGTADRDEELLHDVELQGSIIGDGVSFGNLAPDAFDLGETESQPKGDLIATLVENYDNVTWSVSSGDKIELSGDFKDIYIVDVRPNVLITSVRAKRGETFAEVPSSYYRISYAYSYAGRPMTAIFFDTPLSERLENWQDTVYVAVDTGELSASGMIQNIAGMISKTVDTSGIPTAGNPNYTAYGEAEVLNIIQLLAEESRLGYFIVGDVLKLVYLDANRGSVFNITDSNYYSVEFATTSWQDIVKKTTYTFSDLGGVELSSTYALSSADSILQANSFDVKTFDTKIDSNAFSKWHFNLNTRNWLTATLECFADAAILEPYDIVSLNLTGFINSTAQVVESTYDQETTKTTLLVVFPKDMNGSTATPWYSPEDIVPVKIDKWLGYER